MNITNKMITLCCGNRKAKDIIFSTIIDSSKCFCLKCKRESILITEKEYNQIQKK